MVNPTKSVGSHEDETALPPFLEGVPRLLTTGTVGHIIGASTTWVAELVERGQLKPSAYHVHWRRGAWEPHVLFEPAEVDRYLAETRGRRVSPPKAKRPPQQLRLLLAINGGKA